MDCAEKYDIRKFQAKTKQKFLDGVKTIEPRCNESAISAERVVGVKDGVK